MRQSPIDLSRANIADIPFKRIPGGATWLVLSNNSIRRIPSEIKKLNRIERLALNDNSLVEISEEMTALHKLSWIDMTRNCLKTLPPTLRFNRLVGLGLSENEFEEIPDCVFEFHALRKFGFFANRIRTVSPRIENLQNLVKLDLSNNLLEELPDEICKLQNLTWLNVSNNRLKRLPRDFGKLACLEELGLGNNCLEELPDLDGMRALRVFSAFNNEIASFEMKAGAVRKIDLSGNRIRQFPISLLKIPTLHTLSLKNNLIDEIALGHVEKSNAKSIDLRFNKLSSIPLKFLKSVDKCQVLLFEGNSFTIKKDAFPGIPSLHDICINRNTARRNRPGAGEPSSLRQCDCCNRAFVNDPIRVYFLASLEPEDKFSLEEEVCTNRCYLESIKAKGIRNAFCNKI